MVFTAVYIYGVVSNEMTSTARWCSSHRLIPPQRAASTSEMDILSEELFTSIEERDAARVVQLLDDGAPMNFELFAKATREKQYESLQSFLIMAGTSTHDPTSIA